MSNKFAASPAAPPLARNAEPSAERDTLQAIDQLLSHDQLAALLASPTLARVAARHGASSDDTDADASLFERDTEPGVDARILRDALAVGLK